MGDIWSTSKATAYYDDVKITEISLGVSGIRLDQEEADIVCGETLQLNATDVYKRQTHRGKRSLIYWKIIRNTSLSKRLWKWKNVN